MHFKEQKFANMVNFISIHILQCYIQIVQAETWSQGVEKRQNWYIFVSFWTLAQWYKILPQSLKQHESAEIVSILSQQHKQYVLKLKLYQRHKMRASGMEYGSDSTNFVLASMFRVWENSNQILDVVFKGTLCEIFCTDTRLIGNEIFLWTSDSDQI